MEKVMSSAWLLFLLLAFVERSKSAFEFIDQSTAFKVTNEQVKCPNQLQEKVEGQIDQVVSSSEDCALPSSTSNKLEEICSLETNFEEIAKGVYAAKIEADFASAKTCCASHGLKLLKIERNTLITEFIQDIQSSKFWVEGDYGEGVRICKSLTFPSTFDDGSTSVGGIEKNCSKGLFFLCHGELGTVEKIHEACRVGRRYQKINNQLAAVKFATLTFEEAEICCKARHLTLINLEDANVRKEDVTNFLKDSKGCTYWHAKNQSDPQQCQQIKKGLETLVLRAECEEVASILCMGEWNDNDELKIVDGKNEDVRRCIGSTSKSIMQGKAEVSSKNMELSHSAASSCCEQNGEILLSLDHMTQAQHFANSPWIQTYELYHAYSEEDGLNAGSYLFFQGGKIPNDTLTKSRYNMKSGYCVYAVVEVDLKRGRQTKFLTGANCGHHHRFVCMRVDVESLYNKTCNVTDFLEGEERDKNEHSTEQEFQLRLENRFLGKISINVDIFGWKPMYKEPIRGYNLAARTFQLFRKIVPALPWGFLNKVMILFIEFNSAFGPHNKMDWLSEKDYNWIQDILDKCEANFSIIPYAFNECKTQILGKSDKVTGKVEFNCPSSNFSYNPHTTDPILHTAQNVFHTVRNVCFKTFMEESHRMLHKWQLAIYDCYTRHLDERWNWQIENKSFWNRILGPNSYENVKMTDSALASVLHTPFGYMPCVRGPPGNMRMHGMPAFTR